MIILIGKKRKDDKFKVSFRYSVKTVNAIMAMDKIELELQKHNLVHIGNNVYSDEG